MRSKELLLQAGVWEPWESLGAGAAGSEEGVQREDKRCIE